LPLPVELHVRLPDALPLQQNEKMHKATTIQNTREQASIELPRD